ncbi:hypothetical protein [Streptomyces sp. NPDC001621]|uniref:hypothetical protein n=1 Tax=Streptomyces sp. NPDC001621 TaxID=3364594 RepID=UPI00368EED78
MHSNPERPGRFHLLLASQGQPVQHGWWNSESVARGKLARCGCDAGSVHIAHERRT